MQEAGGRIWIRLMKADKRVKDVIIPADRDAPETALQTALPPLDLSQPMWLPRHRADWEEYAFTRFFSEHFIDSVPFDCMEISYIFPGESERPARRRSVLEDI
jgi:hypothetical protein